MNPTYFKYELVRLVRNKRFFFFSLVFPLCLAPFVGLGIFLGHVLSVDTMGPALGGSVALLAFLGGMFSPLPTTGTLHDIAELLPSYWLTQATHVGVGGPVWEAKGWIVVAAWTVGTVLLATNAYRRDTARV
jgi:ABC-2 type transport system permease protein